MKYVPLSSADASERFFSRYKSILRPKRRTFITSIGTIFRNTMFCRFTEILNGCPNFLIYKLLTVVIPEKHY